jgi:hypothetical protein
MKTTQSITLALLLSIFFLDACTKNEYIVPTSPNLNVYAVGYSTQQNNTNTIAKYWKNGKVTNLTNGEKTAQALSVFVEKNNVHIVGYEFDELIGRTVARYWKNGKMTALPDLGKGSAAYYVFVSSGDVYVGGVVSDDRVRRAVYWKNGSAPQDLTDGKGSVAFDIFGGSNNPFFVYEDNVYAAGVEIRSPTYSVAKYWKNGVAVIVKDPGSMGSATASGIFVNEDAVYVAGYEDSEVAGRQSKYWKITQNALPPTEVLLPGKSSPATFASSITVVGNDVYVGGRVSTQPVYWKNGETALKLFNGENREETLSPLFVFNNDVYVAGYQIPPNTQAATYWKNGRSTQLTPSNNIGKVNEVAYSIFVTRD